MVLETSGWTVILDTSHCASDLDVLANSEERPEPTSSEKPSSSSTCNLRTTSKTTLELSEPVCDAAQNHLRAHLIGSSRLQNLCECELAGANKTS